MKLILVLCLLALALPAEAQAPAGVRGWFLNEVNALEKKYVSLAEAIPQEKYTWRPGEGVRSISEVFLHVAMANFRIPNSMGIKPPASPEPKGFEKSTTEKAQVVEHLKKSFEHLRTAGAGVADSDLDKATKLFGREATNRDVMLVISTHMHEHLGQSIAYARTNNVTPPWSER